MCKYLKKDIYYILGTGKGLINYWCEKNLIRPNEIKFDCEEFRKKDKYNK